jgi:hypothetical protein
LLVVTLSATLAILIVEASIIPEPMSFLRCIIRDMSWNRIAVFRWILFFLVVCARDFVLGKHCICIGVFQNSIPRAKLQVLSNCFQ